MKKPFLEIAPWLIVVFKKPYDLGEDGARAWNAYKDYNNKTKSNDWNTSYENYLKQNTDIGYNYYINELQRTTQRRREDLDDLKQFINMPN